MQSHIPERKSIIPDFRLASDQAADGSTCNAPRPLVLGRAAAIVR